jgi:hypothetical protein
VYRDNRTDDLEVTFLVCASVIAGAAFGLGHLRRRRLPTTSFDGTQLE